jgi:copper chaperone
MNTIIFRTNMKCSGCIDKVTPALDELAGKNHWSVDLTHSDKTLTIQGEHIASSSIQSAVEKAGFRIEKI